MEKSVVNLISLAYEINESNFNSHIIYYYYYIITIIALTSAVMTDHHTKKGFTDCLPSLGHVLCTVC